jgi:hypothetical protein
MDSLGSLKETKKNNKEKDMASTNQSENKSPKKNQQEILKKFSKYLDSDDEDNIPKKKKHVNSIFIDTNQKQLGQRQLTDEELGIIPPINVTAERNKELTLEEKMQKMFNDYHTSDFYEDEDDDEEEETKNEVPKPFLEFKEWRVVISEEFNDIKSQICSVCRSHLKDKCFDCYENIIATFYESGCQVVKHNCKNAFHEHCIEKLKKSAGDKFKCPECHQEWNDTNVEKLV